jgi:phosphohistidine phosphatase
MKKLYLIRHAKAEDTSSTGDFGRCLSVRGNEQAFDLGEALAREKISIDHFYCSSAVRTRETLGQIQKQECYAHTKASFSDELYSASLNTLLYAVASLPAECESAAFVFHNPVCAQLMMHISKDSLDAVKPASCSGFELDIYDWDAVGNEVGEVVFNFRSS